MDKQPHGEKGHFNVLVRDQDSDVTGYGKHCRLAIGLGGGEILCREDIKWGLPLSNDQQRRKAIRRSGLVGRGARIEHVSSEPYQGTLNECIEHIYKFAR